jgi:hypothetical protein
MIKSIPIILYNIFLKNTRQHFSAALLFSNYFFSTSLPSLKVITVAAFSGFPFTKLNPVLEVTNPVNVPFVNASTTFS